MRMQLSALYKKTTAIMGSILAVAVLAVGTFVVAQPALAACDNVNIVRCGLNESRLGATINDFQNRYAKNDSGDGHRDFRAITNWSGITAAQVQGMNANNTKQGTLYRNGNVMVAGKVVGKDAWITARFGGGRAGFVAVPNAAGVFARKTTTEAARNSYPVIVMFDQDGRAISAVVTDCANLIKFRPVTPTKPGVKIEKSVSKDKLDLNEKFTYTIKVKNTGNVDLKNVKVHDREPPNVDFVKASRGKVTKSPTNKHFSTWEYVIPVLKKDDVKEFTITAKVVKYANKDIINTACVNAPAVNKSQPKKWDDCAKVPVTVKQRKPSVKITKDVSKEVVKVGEVFDYKITVTNNGNQKLKNVFVYDCQRANIQFIEADAGKIGDVQGPPPKRGVPPAPCKGWSVKVPVLNVDESKTFTIKAKVTAYVEGEIINTACVNAKEVNPDRPEKDDACDDAPVKVEKLTYACDGDVTVTADPTNKMRYTIGTKMAYSDGVTFKSAVFNFGDGQSATVTKEDPAKTVSTTHVFPEAKTYTVKISLTFVSNDQEVTAPQLCEKNITVKNPYYSCVRLEGVALKDTENGFSFKTTMDYGNGVTFKNADFDFGDGKTEKSVRATDEKTIDIDHTYDEAGTYTVSAVLHFTYEGATVSASPCKALVEYTKITPECKPGIPAGDVRCNPCKYDAQYSADDTTHCVPPQKPKPPVINLPNTGTGGVIAIGLAGILGGFMAYKHLVVKRHKTALAGMKSGTASARGGTPKNAVHVSDHSKTKPKH